MSGLKFYTYPGIGEFAYQVLGYNQAVRVGDRIECSGQGGWLPAEEGAAGINFPESLAEEVKQAFRNVETALKAAGGKGWSQVFRVNSYHTDITPELTAIMTANFKEWMPDHKPIWTQVGVAKLGADQMRVEIEVAAHDPEGSK